MITIFTDGSSRGNPGPGGWGSVIVAGDSVVELGGREEHTTNNRMELVAAISGLTGAFKSGIEKSGKIIVNTDSAYVINGITKWVHGWKKKNWKTLDKKDVVNRDLWEQLDEASIGRNISWNYVGGHVGVMGNERCDVIATSFADNKLVELYRGPVLKYFIPNILDVAVSAAASDKKSSSKSRSSAKAYSYISMVNGIINIDSTWKECESRVKGKSGVKYKKALNKSEETEIMAEFRKNS
jgi:ribonuclease HI